MDAGAGGGADLQQGNSKAHIVTLIQNSCLLSHMMQGYFPLFCQIDGHSNEDVSK